MYKKTIMKNLIIALLITFKGYSQQLNRTNDGYTEVVEVELSKKEIHQKLNEWVAVNYKSANSVVQLNTEDKLIVKGNFALSLSVMKYNFSYRINNTLTLSIRDNKYKIDLAPTGISYEGKNLPSVDLFNRFITSKLLSKEEFLVLNDEMARKSFASAGYSEKKIEKSMKTLSRYNKTDYEDYLKNKANWDNAINSTFKSIKDYLNKSKTEEDW